MREAIWMPLRSLGYVSPEVPMMWRDRLVGRSGRECFAGSHAAQAKVQRCTLLTSFSRHYSQVCGLATARRFQYSLDFLSPRPSGPMPDSTYHHAILGLFYGR